MNNKQKLFLIKLASQQAPQEFMGVNGKPIAFDEDPNPNTLPISPELFNAPLQSQVAAKGTPHEAWQQSGGSPEFPASSIGVSPTTQQQPQMANSSPTLPGKPVNGTDFPPSGKPTTPLNGLPGYAVGANRPSQQYDSAGTPEGFPGYSPDPASDPFQKKPVGPAAGGAQSVLPPPTGGVQGLGSMSNRAMPITR